MSKKSCLDEIFITSVELHNALVSHKQTQVIGIYPYNKTTVKHTYHRFLKNTPKINLILEDNLDFPPNSLNSIFSQIEKIVCETKKKVVLFLIEQTNLYKFKTKHLPEYKLYLTITNHAANIYTQQNNKFIDFKLATCTPDWHSRLFHGDTELDILSDPSCLGSSHFQQFVHSFNGLTLNNFLKMYHSDESVFNSNKKSDFSHRTIAMSGELASFTEPFKNVEQDLSYLNNVQLEHNDIENKLRQGINKLINYESNVAQDQASSFTLITANSTTLPVTPTKHTHNRKSPITPSPKSNRVMSDVPSSLRNISEKLKDTKQDLSLNAYMIKTHGRNWDYVPKVNGVVSLIDSGSFRSEYNTHGIQHFIDRYTLTDFADGELYDSGPEFIRNFLMKLDMNAVGYMAPDESRVPLANCYNNCFFNSLVQCLMRVKHFSSMLTVYTLGCVSVYDCADKSKATTEQLPRLAALILLSNLFSTTVHNPKACDDQGCKYLYLMEQLIVKEFKFTLGQQNDPSELFLAMDNSLRVVEEAHSKEYLKQFLFSPMRLFQGQISDTVCCGNCGKCESNTTFFNFVHLNSVQTVVTSKDVNAHLSAKLNEQMSVTKYVGECDCSPKGKVNKTKTEKRAAWPDTLILLFSIFDYSHGYCAKQKSSYKWQHNSPADIALTVMGERENYVYRPVAQLYNCASTPERGHYLARVPVDRHNENFDYSKNEWEFVSDTSMSSSLNTLHDRYTDKNEVELYMMFLQKYKAESQRLVVETLQNDGAPLYAKAVREFFN